MRVKAKSEVAAVKCIALKYFWCIQIATFLTSKHSPCVKNTNLPINSKTRIKSIGFSSVFCASYLNRTYHFCITFDLKDESYVCYAFWVPYDVYIKDFSKFKYFTLVQNIAFSIVIMNKIINCKKIGNFLVNFFVPCLINRMFFQ